MKLLEFIEYLEDNYSSRWVQIEDYGLIYGKVNKNTPVKKVHLTNYLTLESIHQAVSEKADLIISLKRQISLQNSYDDLFIKKMSLLTRYPIKIYNLPPSYGKNGICESICSLCFLEILDVIEFKSNKRNIPIGRLCTPHPSEIKFTLEMLLNKISYHDNTNQYIEYVGELTRELKSIAVIPGKMYKSLIKKAEQLNCDAIIVNSFEFNEVMDAKERGIETVKFPVEILYNHYLAQLKNSLSLRFPRISFTNSELSRYIKYYQ